MVHDLLSRTPWDRAERGEEFRRNVGIDRLIAAGVYQSAFPLHEVSARNDTGQIRRAAQLGKIGRGGPRSRVSRRVTRSI